MQVRTLRKGFLIATAGSVITGLAIIGTRLFAKGRQRDAAAAVIIGQLAIIYDRYRKGLGGFVEDTGTALSAAEQFAQLDTIIRIDTSPWDIFPVIDPRTPEILKLFVNGPNELLVHLQRRLEGSGLPLNDYRYLRGDSSDSLCIQLNVEDKELIAAVTAKLTNS